MDIVRILAVAAVAMATLNHSVWALRDQIQVVGSSTFRPFADRISERNVKMNGGRQLEISTNGTNKGLKKFCDSDLSLPPDILLASRRMTAREFVRCESAGVSVIEGFLGFDGIVLGQANDARPLNLTLAELYIALASDAGRPKTWSHVNRSLPKTLIRVHGPPPSSGTRDVFEAKMLRQGCLDYHGNPSKCMEVAVRLDGAWIDAGENDNVIVRALLKDSTIVGVFGFSYLDKNNHVIRAIPLDGVRPNVTSIANLSYAGSRALFWYVNGTHLGAVPGLRSIIDALLEASAADSYLQDAGLVPMTEADAQLNTKTVSQRIQQISD